MKKSILILAILIGSLGFSAMKDGIYYVEKTDGNGWTSFVKLTVKSDKIIGAQYDRKNSAGELLSINQNENEKYRRDFGESFRDTSYKMTRTLVSNQNTDSIGGIKNSKALSEFKEMVKFLIDKSNEGKTGNYKL